MIKSTYIQTLFDALNKYGVKYAIVGGLAVNFHGYQRFTKDIDLLVSLVADDLESLVACLKYLDFKPIYPIALEEILDEEKRRLWVEQRNMTVFSVVSDQMPSLTLDLFVLPPYSYQEIQPDIITESIGGNLELPVIDLHRLIEMKKLAGRPQDLIDIEYLTKLSNEHLP